MIAETMINGQLVRSLVHEEHPRSVVIWLPGDKCKRCSGTGRLRWTEWKERRRDCKHTPSGFVYERIQIKTEVSGCPQCSSSGHSSQWKLVTIPKKRIIRLMPCPPLCWPSFTYYAPDFKTRRNHARSST